MSNFSKEHYLAIIGALFSIIGAVMSIAIEFYDKAEKRNSLMYEKQIDSLNQIENSINILKEFVQNQKKYLEESQIAVNLLKEEEELLKPVVEADRKIVDALFKIQAQQQSKSIWLDRAFGFFIGIASSLVASLFWAYARRKNV
jgi:hypothetical protein